jgi:uncharacterized NAD(P)/FAD-binding protein YdhS
MYWLPEPQWVADALLEFAERDREASWPSTWVRGIVPDRQAQLANRVYGVGVFRAWDLRQRDRLVRLMVREYRDSGLTLRQAIDKVRRDFSKLSEELSVSTIRGILRRIP